MIPLPKGENKLLEWAIFYSSYGFSVFPLIGKKPRARSKWIPYRTKPLKGYRLRKAFSRPDATGIAIIAGSCSIMIAIMDFDTAEAYHLWAANNPIEAARQPTVRTRRGFHVYGIVPHEYWIKVPSVGEFIGNQKHFFVAAPSRHPDEPIDYTWVVNLPENPADLPPMPASLLPPGFWDKPLTSPKKTKTKLATHARDDSAGFCLPTECVNLDSLGVLQDRVWQAILGTLPDKIGERNNRLMELAMRLRAIEGLGVSFLPSIVQAWFSTGYANIGSKNLQESMKDFERAWWLLDRQYRPSPRIVYDAACHDSDGAIDNNGRMGILSAMCRIMGANGRTFWLASRTIATLFGINRDTGLDWLNRLVRRSVIEVVEEGDYNKCKATRYKYLGRQN